MLLTSFESMITNPLCIFAILSVGFGITAILLAGRITKLYRKTDKVEDSDKVLLGIKIAGITLILLGFVLMMVWGAEVL